MLLCVYSTDMRAYEGLGQQHCLLVDNDCGGDADAPQGGAGRFA